MSRREPTRAEVLAIARRVCTTAQLRAIECHESGMGYRMASRELGISPTALRDRLDRGMTRVMAIWNLEG